MDVIGHNVVRLASTQASAGGTPRHACRHGRIRISEGRREVACRDCGEALDPFDALVRVATSTDVAERRLSRLEDALSEVEAASFSTRVAKAIDAAWSVPGRAVRCPRCGDGVRPSDFLARGVEGVPSV